MEGHTASAQQATLVDLIDELFIVAPPEQVRAVVCDVERWRTWFPGLVLTAYDDRGRRGVRWTVGGELVGTAEVWLQEHGDGTIVHTYLRANPRRNDPHRLVRSRRRAVARYGRPLKRHLLAVKDALEGDRPPGTARVRIGDRVSSASDDRQGTRRTRLRLPSGTTTEGAPPDGRPDDLQHRRRS